ncbi:MAG: ring-cleaving dioxygenase [Pseudomonadota bacterium]
MPTQTVGLHHVTAISGPPQANLDFYVTVLGQRLVKRTVNFDDPGTYHFYYGDRVGTPGTILTFFPFVDAGPGRAGPGMASAVAYAAVPAEFEALMMRLAEDGEAFGGPIERFEQRCITLSDPDGLAVEVIETPDAPKNSFHSVTLWLTDPRPTVRVLSDFLGYQEVGAEQRDGRDRIRMQTTDGGHASVIDIVTDDTASIGRQGAGTIHHIAFRASDDDHQLAFRDQLLSGGLDVTPVIDRQYFNAIYFREPGGVLFEIATDPPGFSTDEPVDTLGAALKLPAQYENRRDQIERRLPEISPPPWSDA